MTNARRYLAVLAALALVACRAPTPITPTHPPRFGAVVGPGGAPLPVYYSSPPTLTNGQATPPLVDALGNAQVTEKTLLAGEDLTNNVIKVEQRFSYTHQAGTTAGVNIKSGAGFLHCVTVNTPAASAVITLDDAISATTPTIAVITLPATLVNEGPTTACYDVAFNTGLELVVATGAADVTVSWR